MSIALFGIVLKCNRIRLTWPPNVLKLEINLYSKQHTISGRLSLCLIMAPYVSQNRVGSVGHNRGPKQQFWKLATELCSYYWQHRNLFLFWSCLWEYIIILFNRYCLRYCKKNYYINIRTERWLFKEICKIQVIFSLNHHFGFLISVLILHHRQIQGGVFFSSSSFLLLYHH